jgi:hypothetical protein
MQSQGKQQEEGMAVKKIPNVSSAEAVVHAFLGGAAVSRW